MLKQLVLFTLLLMLAACASVQEELKNYVKKPQVTYQSIEMTKLTMEEIIINPTFNINNSNAFPLPINNINYTLSLNEQQLLTGESDAIGTLPANNNKDVSLSLALTKETLTSLQQLLLNNKQFDYQIKGSVNTMGLSIPFEKSDTIYMPEVSINNLQIINANFNQLDLLLVLDLNNKNDFDLPLDEIDYSVSSKNTSLFSGALNSQKLTKGDSRIELPLSIKLNELFTNVFSLLMNPNLPLHIEINSPLFTRTYDQTLNLSSFFE